MIFATFDTFVPSSAPFNALISDAVYGLRAGSFFDFFATALSFDSRAL